MPSNSLLVRFFTFAVVLFGTCVFRIEATQEGPGFQRVARNFPYSLAFRQMFRPASASIQPVAMFQWPEPAQSRDVRDVINWLDENGQQPAYGRERRSAGPVFKRYACRFKFCRIY